MEEKETGVASGADPQHEVYLSQGSGLGSEIWSWAECLWTDEEQQKDCGGSPSPEQTAQTAGLKTTF